MQCILDGILVYYVVIGVIISGGFISVGLFAKQKTVVRLKKSAKRTAKPASVTEYVETLPADLRDLLGSRASSS